METFDELILSSTPVLVDFFAEWCAPCKMMKPILENVKEELGDSVRIVKIDVDKKQGLAARYHIQSVPTLMLFKGGETLWRASGVRQKEELKEIIAQNSK